MPQAPLMGLNPLTDLDVETLILTGLEALEENGITSFHGEYDFKSLRYPDDIEHFFMQGHYINLYINVQRSSRYYTGGSTNAETGQQTPASYNYPIQNQTTFGIPNPLLPTSQQYNTTNYDYFGRAIEASGNLGSMASTYSTQRITQAISLYIPDTMSFSSQLGWEASSLQEMGGRLLQGIAGGLDTLMKGNPFSALMHKGGKLYDIGRDVGGAFGYAINPQLLVLFRGIGLRTFTYDFFFTPKNEREAESIRNIVRAIRFHAHPEASEFYGLYYIAPSTFDIDFMHRGRRNTKIHQVKTCVLTNYTVDYAPFGWSTFVDGMPIQTRLTLTFQEIEALTKQDVAQGY